MLENTSQRHEGSSSGSSISSWGDGRTRSNVQQTASGDGETANAIKAPAINLPKGGGAIRGIDEKFQVNPATGTASLTVPITTSPGRSGFGPQLSLSYDSGAGNGPFGFGWNLSLPSVTRKTDKGLPRYRDAEESDVFILSGTEDLVPVLEQNAQGDWERKVRKRPPHAPDHRIDFYRPRIEGLFARVERWTNLDNPKDVFWRSISKDNITTWYGKTENSRIFDPADHTRIFSWLICQSYDDKGNAIVYEYKPENSQRIFVDDKGNQASLVHERNPTDDNREANRYLKSIKYGNDSPNRDADWGPTDPTTLSRDGWMFEVVFDYGEGHYEEPPLNADQDPDEQHEYVQVKLAPDGEWPRRQDPFSSYRAGFEVRTYRLCRRILMFHQFPEELSTGNYLVRSTSFTYKESPVASFITSVTQSGYVHKPTETHPNRYLEKSLPPLEFEYSEAAINDEIQEIDRESVENLPNGLDGAQYRLVDLDGEGLSGILAEQAGTWFYKPNLGDGRFGPLEAVAQQPSRVDLNGGLQQLLDLAGDGQLDLVSFQEPTPGFYERTQDENWAPHRPFVSLPNIDWDDPNLRFVDLTGDGHADVLVTENDTFIWYLSLAEEGFGEAESSYQSLDEEKGPRLLFADGTQSIYLADISGDGLADLARIRNGEICYWPNLGYGRFGSKVTMDNAPLFDHPDQFDQKRIRLADIDGSGTTDILYLNHEAVKLWFNQAGNSWGSGEEVSLPAYDNFSNITVADLKGNGTTCLVLSSSLPATKGKPLQYIDLIGEQKPHLLTKVTNNLGAETRVHYASSTKFYLADKAAGRPWITRLPFPVHVVERVETYDRLSRNRFVTRYTYHHGHFDGEEREFRGFGMVEQRDTEEIGVLSESGDSPAGENIDEQSYVPPVLTKTWYHTGCHFDGECVSRQFANEYYEEGDPSQGMAELTESQLSSMRLDDTVMPAGILQLDGSYGPHDLSPEEAREASRALRGSLLRQEVYASDGTEEEDRPYTVSERNYTIEFLQPQGINRHAVFFTHERETIDFHYERELFKVDGRLLADPRVTHTMTLEVDGYGNTRLSASIGYGRRHASDDPLLTDDDADRQKKALITYTRNSTTNNIDTGTAYRIPLISETRVYELLNVAPDRNEPRVTNLFSFDEMAIKIEAASDGNHDIPYQDLASTAIADDNPDPYRRLIEHGRTCFRADDLSRLLSPGELQPMALPGETYKLVFTLALIQDIYGSRVSGTMMEEGGFVHTENDTNWWMPSGLIFYKEDVDLDDPNSVDQELATARDYFFLPRRFHDPFGHKALVRYDRYNLLLVETEDALGNRVTAGIRTNDSISNENDYRVLQPTMVTDPNDNHSEVVFDALGLVTATATWGINADGAREGDNLDNVEANLNQAQIDAFFANPKGQAAASLLGNATTRIIYDVNRYHRSHDPDYPIFATTMVRDTHVETPTNTDTEIQVSFTYSDGFGREIQKKIQAEPEKTNGVTGPPRWVGSGWTIFNNKGRPVRKYEPFFDDTHDFRFGCKEGVSSTLFYDPVGRVLARLHPNHTYEKVVFDPWRQVTYDVNDTVHLDPSQDEDVKAFFVNPDGTPRLPADEYLPTWLEQRVDPQNLPADTRKLEPEKKAAVRTFLHADTPTMVYLDSLGRPFLTLAHNRYEQNGADVDEMYATRVELDIEGNQRLVRDERKKQDGTREQRIVMQYKYNIAGPEQDENGEPILTNRVHQSSMEAGERWMLNDVMGNPIYAWDSRDFTRRMIYDELRRPTGLYVTEDGKERLAEETIYGEGQGAGNNLRTRVWKVRDAAGTVENVSYDFKGNLLESRRDLLANYKEPVDWEQEPTPDYGSYTTTTTYDALNRPVTVTTPDNSVYCATFNDANLLEKVDVNLRGAVEATPFIINIDYNEKGQRKRITYGCGADPTDSTSGTTTIYDYDDKTFRLTQLTTTRPAGLNGAATRLFVDSTSVQDLHYTYDPAGNIIQIEDRALKTIQYNNEDVQPVSHFKYDALYRLIEAHGREHVGQTVFDLQPPHNRRDYSFVGNRAHPNDPTALRNYTECYVYDEVGNIERMRRIANGGSWTRTYYYEEETLIETDKASNRLSATRVGKVGNGFRFTETYSYRDAQDNDGNGCMTAINEMTMTWDFKDQLQKINLGSGGTAYYVYDAGGQRVRKVIERQNGALQKERLYLGGYEVYRELNRNGDDVDLERETLHIMDEKQRIALVETRTKGNKPSVPARLIRYQLGNHLCSASVELAEDGNLISYEEYHPYGTTAFQSGRSTAEVKLKRYRYTGKERDEESGFYYHGARYYAPWLGRWMSCEPNYEPDNVSLYTYVKNNPTIFLDPNGHKEASGIQGSSWASQKDPRNLGVQRDMYLVGQIYFRTNESGLDREDRAALRLLTTQIRRKTGGSQYPGETLLLFVGHADVRGTERHNLQLSERRARKTAAHFRLFFYDRDTIKAYGDRLTTKEVGKGETENAIALSEERSGHLMDYRRVDIYALTKDIVDLELFDEGWVDVEADARDRALIVNSVSQRSKNREAEESARAEAEQRLATRIEKVIAQIKSNYQDYEIEIDVSEVEIKSWESSYSIDSRDVPAGPIDIPIVDEQIVYTARAKATLQYRIFLK